MSKLLLLSLLLISTFFASAQETQKGIWQHSKEKYIYTIYFDGQFVEITDYTASSYPKGGITSSKRHFGFYNSCDVPSIDSLQSSGSYYIEFYNDEVNSDGSIENYECLELSFSKESGEEYMSVHWSSQQRFSTYKRLQKLPKNLEEYLKKEHPEIYVEYSRL